VRHTHIKSNNINQAGISHQNIFYKINFIEESTPDHAVHAEASMVMNCQVVGFATMFLLMELFQFLLYFQFPPLLLFLLIIPSGLFFS